MVEDITYVLGSMGQDSCVNLFIIFYYASQLKMKFNEWSRLILTVYPEVIILFNDNIYSVVTFVIVSCLFRSPFGMRQ